MQTSIETLTDVELRVAVEVPADAVDREYAAQLKKARGTARVKGFRAGKAPMDMVRKLYGQQVASDTAMKLIENSMDAAIDAVERTIVSQPQVEPSLAQPGEAMTYHMRVEVKPQIKVHDWKALDISVAPATLDPSVVEDEIEHMREQHKERIPVEGRGAAENDVVILDGGGSLDGTPDERLSVTGMEVKLGSGQLIPGFEEQLTGVEVGEERQVTLSFPEDYGHAEMAGKPAVFDVKIEGLFAEELPELDDDFAQDVEFDTMEALRTDITTRLQTKADDERKQQLDDKTVAMLIERHTCLAPPAMVRGQLEHSARRLVMMMAMQGIPHEQAVQMAQSNQQQLAVEAETTVKRFLLLEALAETEGVTVTDEALQAELDQRVASGGEQAATHYERDEAREGLRLELLERAALDLVQEHANITDAEPEADTAAEDTADDASEGNNPED